MIVPEQRIQRGRHPKVLVDRLEEREVEDFLRVDKAGLGTRVGSTLLTKKHTSLTSRSAMQGWLEPIMNGASSVNHVF